MLPIHPNFIWNTPLAKAIKQYTFFNYPVKVTGQSTQQHIHDKLIEKPEKSYLL